MKRCLTQQKRCLQLTRPHPKPRPFRFSFLVCLLVLCSHTKCKSQKSPPTTALPGDRLASECGCGCGGSQRGHQMRQVSMPLLHSSSSTPLSGLADTDADRQGVTAERRNPPKPAAPVVTPCDAQRALRSRDVFETSWIKHVGGGRRPYRPDRLLSKAPALPTFISHLAEHKSAC